jgi:hypothetical protein
MVFALSRKNYLGDRATIAQVGEPEVPVISVATVPSAFPLDVGRLTANVISMLNGEDPQHSISAGTHKVYWRDRGNNGIEFRHQDDGKGMTQPGISFIVNEGCPDALAEDVLARLKDPAGLKSLCDNITRTEPSGGGSRPSPSAGP